MIDIHCHILPYIDDGADSMDHALDMADIAVSTGVSAICVTPHTNLFQGSPNYESAELTDLFDRFVAALHQERIPLTVYRGAEIFADSVSLDLVKEGRIRTMNGTRHCLMEFDFDESPGVIEHTVKNYVDAGYVPVIAHPERYECVIEDPLLVRFWLEMGALSQINKGSVLGKFGSACEMCADFLLDEELVSCVASDAHSPYMRTTEMREIERYLARVYSREFSNLLLKENPRRILGV